MQIYRRVSAAERITYLFEIANKDYFFYSSFSFFVLSYRCAHRAVFISTYTRRFYLHRGHSREFRSVIRITRDTNGENVTSRCVVALSNRLQGACRGSLPTISRPIFFSSTRRSEYRAKVPLQRR